MENVQVQRKKMSLANIEGKLTPEEMENVMAGSWGWRGCSNIEALTAAGVGCAITGGPWGGVAALCMIGYFGCH